MFQKAGLTLNTDQYSEIPYLKINSIKLYNKDRDNICSLLGSPWAATSQENEPYLVQYGYISNRNEINSCIYNLTPTGPSQYFLVISSS